MLLPLRACWSAAPHLVFAPLLVAVFAPPCLCGQAFNEKISPLFHVDNIVAPLLIGQGANDPRVKQAEADQIAFSMAAKEIPVEYVLYPDEGHGFARPANRIDFNGRTEAFLAEHLGGRAEAFTPPDGATATFPLQTRAYEYEPAMAVF